MTLPTPLTDNALADLRVGDELLDRGTRGPAPELALLRGIGLLTAPLPLKAGGKGWGTQPAGALVMMRVLMDLGSASLAVARLYEGHVNAVRLVLENGSASQCERVSSAVVEGALMAVWTADSAKPVSVVSSPSGPVLHGTKAFASGLGDVRLAVLSATTDRGLQLLLADATDPGRADMSCWDMDAMVGSRSGQFDCGGLPADENDRVGAVDAFFDEPQFHGGIWRLCACYSGAMRGIADDLAVLTERRGFHDDALMQHRLGLVAIEAQTGALWTQAACHSAETGTDYNSIMSTVLFAREAVEQAAERLMTHAERIGGTALHQRRSRLGRRIRDLRLYLRQAQLDGKLALATGCWRHVRKDGCDGE